MAQPRPTVEEANFCRATSGRRHQTPRFPVVEDGAPSRANHRGAAAPVAHMEPCAVKLRGRGRPLFSKARDRGGPAMMSGFLLAQRLGAGTDAVLRCNSRSPASHPGAACIAKSERGLSHAERCRQTFGVNLSDEAACRLRAKLIPRRSKTADGGLGITRIIPSKVAGLEADRAD